MLGLIEGQILWLRIRLDYFGVFDDVHPYLILHIDNEEKTIEVGQLHSLEGKEYEAIAEENAIIHNSAPKESVLTKSSFMQCNNTIKLELFESLSKYRRTSDTLTEHKFARVVKKYDKYHSTHEIPDDHIVFLDKDEIVSLNEKI